MELVATGRWRVPGRVLVSGGPLSGAPPPTSPSSTSFPLLACSHQRLLLTNSSEPSLTAHSQKTGEVHQEGPPRCPSDKKPQDTPTAPAPQRERRLPPASETPSVSDGPHVLLPRTRNGEGRSPCASSLKLILLRSQGEWRHMLRFDALFLSSFG